MSTTATVVLDAAASDPRALDVRTGGRGTWALLLVDVDRDPAPDDVLPRVAAALRDAAGPRGVVRRFGGTVFVVLVPVGGPGTARDAVDAAHRAVAALGPAPRGVTASVGAAVLTPTGPEDLPALLWAADRALYAAKRAGGAPTA